MKYNDYFSIVIMSALMLSLTACGAKKEQAIADTSAHQVENAQYTGSKQVSESLNDVRTLEKAKKLSHDATQYAHLAWRFIHQAEPIVFNRQLEIIDEQVRQPIRQISTDWLTQVKMTDAVTEGHYALCRKMLTSLDVLARATLENHASIEQKKAHYLRDKAECQKAIEHPELGNTDPKLLK